MVRRAFLLLLLATTAASVRAGDPEVVKRARQALAGAKAELDRIEMEMIRAYRDVQQDFTRLRGPRGTKIRQDIANVVAAVVETTPTGDGFEETVTQTLQTRLATAGLLSPAAAERFATGVAERVAHFGAEGTSAEAAAAVLDSIFSGRSVDRIWDEVFIDLDTVVEWRRVNVELAKARLELDRTTAQDSADVEPPAGMVLVPAGKFTFGPHDSGWPTQYRTKERARQETLQGFYIDRHEVTNRQYAEFLAKLSPKERADFVPAHWKGDPPTFPRGGEQRPVTNVTFVQAAGFAKSLGRDLPTEMEWEKAARGDDTAFKWPWGDTFDENALVWGGRSKRPSFVLSRRGDTSPYFVADMAGNVKEWTSTLASGKSQLKGQPGPTDEIVIRGGSYQTTNRLETTTIYRWVLVGPAGKDEEVGFRCVLDESDWRKQVAREAVR